MRGRAPLRTLALLAALAQWHAWRAAPLAAEPADVPPWRREAPAPAELRPSPATFEDQRPPGIEIVWFDPLDALPCRFEEVAREADRVFQAMGVAVRWLEAGPDTFSRPPQIHAVLSDGREVPGRELTLGATLKDAAGGPRLWVSLPAVKRTLGLDPTPRRVLSPGQARQVARAVARVLAHEVIHGVAPSLPHAERGLMSHRMTRTFLLSDSFAFDAASAAALRAGVRVLQASR